MIYYGGIGKSFQYPETIDLSKEIISSWEVKKLKGWKSPNLVIEFKSKRFEQPTPLIVNYEDVLKWLKRK